MHAMPANGAARRTLLRLSAASLLSMGLKAPAATAPLRRSALVIGNGAYKSAPLKNPVGDAVAVAGSLKDLGYEVTLRQNTTLFDLIESLRDFSLRSILGFPHLLMALGYMALPAALMIGVPHWVLSLYVDPAAPKNAAMVSFAVQYLAIAAAFQLFDGMQAVLAGALRGLQEALVLQLRLECEAQVQQAEQRLRTRLAQSRVELSQLDRGLHATLDQLLAVLFCGRQFGHAKIALPHDDRSQNSHRHQDGAAHLQTGENIFHRRQQTALDDPSVADPQPARLTLAEQRICRLCGLNLLAPGLAPYRHVAGHLTIVNDGCSMRLDPIVVAVLAAVLDQTDPRAPIFESQPEVLEGFDGHVRMTDDVVWPTDQLILGKAADFDEIPVDVGDLPF